MLPADVSEKLKKNIWLGAESVTSFRELEMLSVMFYWWDKIFDEASETSRSRIIKNSALDNVEKLSRYWALS